MLIGIDRYRSPIQPLANAVRDVRDVAAVLNKSHGYEVHLVEDEQATGAGLKQLLEDLPGRLSPDARFLLYFAGHGVAEDLFDRGDGNEGFLLPCDANRDDPASFWPMAQVKDLLGRLPCRTSS